MEGFSVECQPECLAQPYGPLCDIALNLLDDMFQGVYNDKKKHNEDVSLVLKRARSVGCNRFIVTCGCVDEAVAAKNLLSELKSEFEIYMTVGVHPTRCAVFESDADSNIAELSRLIEEGCETGAVVAIGECGLDYDRTHFCEDTLQKRGFALQLELAEKYKLPLFLHDRNTGGDFLEIMTANISKLSAGGVVHSFTGTVEEMLSYTALGLYIGINGCSLKTEENLRVVAQIPLDRLLLETDAPWCGIKNTHASKPLVKTNFSSIKKEKYAVGVMVKDRAEPCHIINVLEVIAALHAMDPRDVAAQVHANTNALFFSNTYNVAL